MNNYLCKLIDFRRHKELRNFGIYKITNIVSNKFYIGSSASKQGIFSRIAGHLHTLKHNEHSNGILQNSFNLYGEDSFYLEILEICNKSDCLEREQYYLDNLKPEYNILKIAGSPSGTKHTEESKKKMRETRLKFYSDNPDKKKEMSNILKGRKLTKEWRENISKSKIGKKNIRNNVKYYKRPILQFGLDGNFIKEWPSITEVTNSIKILGQNIYKSANSNTRNAGGFKWKYKN